MFPHVSACFRMFVEKADRMFTIHARDRARYATRWMLTVRRSHKFGEAPARAKAPARIPITATPSSSSSNSAEKPSPARPDTTGYAAPMQPAPTCAQRNWPRCSPVTCAGWAGAQKVTAPGRAMRRFFQARRSQRSGRQAEARAQALSGERRRFPIKHLIALSMQPLIQHRVPLQGTREPLSPTEDVPLIVEGLSRWWK